MGEEASRRWNLGASLSPRAGQHPKAAPRRHPHGGSASAQQHSRVEHLHQRRLLRLPGQLGVTVDQPLDGAVSLRAGWGGVQIVRVQIQRAQDVIDS